MNIGVKILVLVKSRNISEFAVIIVIKYPTLKQIKLLHLKTFS
jgi:hypothetical protein